MKQPRFNRKKENPDSSVNDKQKQPSGGKNINWFYFFLFGIILWFSIFSNPTTTAKEISWTFLHDSLLVPGEVSKIVVINKEVAEIYIKTKEVGSAKNEDEIDNIFGSAEPPKYRMTIGSVATFEDKLQRAQQDFQSTDKIDVQYKTQTSWVSILSWLLPLGLLILFWMFVLRRMGGA